MKGTKNKIDTVDRTEEEIEMGKKRIRANYLFAC